MSYIIGVGTWLPDLIRHNSAWPVNFGAKTKAEDRTFNDIQESEDPIAAAITARDLQLEASDPFLGCNERRVSVDHESTFTEAEACLRALEDAGVDPKDVDFVFSNAMVPDRISPPSASDVIQRIGATKAFGIGIDVACASAIVQMQLAHAYIEAGLAKYILLTQSHLLTRTMPLTHPASPGLGDGTSAFLMSKERGRGLKVRGFKYATHGDHYNSVCYVRTDDKPWWQEGGSFRLGTKDPAGCKYLMRETVCFGAKTIEGATQDAGVEVKDINTICSVQPRGFIPGAIAERLGLERKVAVTTYDRLAHLGVAGPIFNLKQARDNGQLGDCVALYAQGLGFARCAAILTQV